MRDREILCVIFFFFLFCCCLTCFFFFRVTRLIKGSNSKKSGAGNIRESLLLDDQRFPSSSSLFLSLVGESSIPSPSLAFILTSTFEPSLPIFPRPTLDLFRHPGVPPSMMSSTPVLGLSWNAGGQRWARSLRVLETEPGRNPFYLYATGAYECPTKEQRRSSIIRQSPEQPTGMRHRHAPFLFFFFHDHEEQLLSEPVGIQSNMNPAEPVFPFIATTTTGARAPPESNTTRPQAPSRNSTTTTGSSIRYTYALETVTYPTAPPGRFRCRSR
jgi:hypothetical protein